MEYLSREYFGFDGNTDTLEENRRAEISDTLASQGEGFERMSLGPGRGKDELSNAFEYFIWEIVEKASEGRI